MVVLCQSLLEMMRVSINAENKEAEMEQTREILQWNVLPCCKWQGITPKSVKNHLLPCCYCLKINCEWDWIQSTIILQSKETNKKFESPKAKCQHLYGLAKDLLDNDHDSLCHGHDWFPQYGLGSCVCVGIKILVHDPNDEPFSFLKKGKKIY